MSEIKYIDQVSDFDMNQKGSFFDFWDTLKIFTWTTKIKSSYKLLEWNKGGVFDILKIYFSPTLWVHIQLYTDMVLLF